jgi:hypothetical protein
MTKNVYGMLMFIAGAAVGAAIAVKIVQKKYEKRANEEIESVREYYASKKSEKVKEEIKKLDEIKALDGEEKIDAYLKVLEDSGYVSRELEEQTTEKKEIVTVERKSDTALISPEELGELVEEYDRCFDIVTLVYYADNVMVYHEDEHLVDDIDDLVGTEFRDHFGDYENDAVFVRNFRNETDYEIIRDEDKYYDIWPKERGEEDG